MIIPSIDLMNGRAVQLVGGKTLEIDAGDPRPLLEKFALVGPVAIIDLDAAMGRGSNAELIEELLRIAPCRVGGGIRDVETALNWLDRGASQVILGTAATPEILKQIPRDRVIAALDADGEDVVVEGWTEKNGARVFEQIDRLRAYVGGFLVTAVEREGRCVGVDIERTKALVECAGDARVTVAGGVCSAEEIAAIDAAGADAQVGMAIYRGDVSLADAFSAPIRARLGEGPWPTVVVDEDERALGLVWSTSESLTRAIDTKRGVYFSRSRGRLWAKGETSGATQELLGVALDCDRDALRVKVRQAGPGFCHERTASCWGEASGLSRLEQTLAVRRDSAPDGSYVKRLLEDESLLADKLVEEATELTQARTKERVVEEAADVLFFTLTRLTQSGASLADVERELDRRALRVRRRGGQRKPKIVTRAAPSNDERPFTDEQLERAQSIVEDVRDCGLEAALAWSERLDGKAPEKVIFEREDLDAALNRLEPERRALLERTAERIRDFAVAQRSSATDVEVGIEGGVASQSWIPVQRAGCYAPAGRYELPSSVLMTVLPAAVAGVEDICVATPRASDTMLAAARIAGATRMLQLGGAQAIATLAFGVPGQLEPRDVIVGPGNAWVTAAKYVVSSVCGIDMLAGPSELTIVVDNTADPAWVAADLLAQAEHDVLARPKVLAISGAPEAEIRDEVKRQLEALPTADVAREALSGGWLERFDTREAARARCDEIAPEHLHLCVASAEEFGRSVGNAGAIFVGRLSAEVSGDYGAGPNHVLPTGRTARYRAGLSVFDFMRPRTSLRVDSQVEHTDFLSDVEMLAEIEQLPGHARAARIRLVGDRKAQLR